VRFWVKRPGGNGTRYHCPPTIRLVNLPATVTINADRSLTEPPTGS
jgi:hypothetical protein